MNKIQKFVLVLVILFSSLTLSLTMLRSGLNYDFGIGFWGPNGHDAIWHLSLINQLKSNIPPLNPIFSGTTLSNYHWGFNLVVALLSNLLKISPSILYFQILPPLFAILIGTLSFLLAYKITKNYYQSLFFVILNYFAGSFGWIYTLVTSGSLGGESQFWSMQSASTLLNPPYALSLVILLFGLILFLTQKLNTKNSILLGFIFSLLTLSKIYAAIIFGFALATTIIISFLKTKKLSKYDLIIFSSFSFFFLIFSYYLGIFNSESLVVFRPLWFPTTMIESIDKFYLPRLASYRFNLSQNITLIKLPVFLFIELLLLLIFIIGNSGIRIFGIKEIMVNPKFFNKKFLLISFMLFFSLIFPLLFIQKGTAWNTIQFFYYFLFFLNFYTATFLAKLLKNYKILTIILLFTAATTSYPTLKNYFGYPPPSAIPKNEVQALNFLSIQKPGITLTHPYNKFKKDELKLSTPIPTYLYETTAYVSAFSGNQSFLEDEMNLDITGFDWQTRRSEALKFFSSTDSNVSRGFLLNNNISYIYLVDWQALSLSTLDLGLDLIYDNDGVRIYRVQR